MTLDPELLVRVTGIEDLLPMVTLPNDRLLGFRTSCPDGTPVPESERLVTGFEASLLKVTVALNTPAAFGVNATVTAALCPAAMAIGSVGAVIAKYFVETEALLIVIDPVPEFIAVTVRVLLPPAATLPKSRLRFARERFPFDCGFVPALTP